MHEQCKCTVDSSLSVLPHGLPCRRRSQIRYAPVQPRRQRLLSMHRLERLWRGTSSARVPGEQLAPTVPRAHSQDLSPDLAADRAGRLLSDHVGALLGPEPRAHVARHD